MIHQFGHRSGRGSYENTKFSSSAEVYDAPKIKDSLIYGGRIFDTAKIKNSSVSGYATISGDSYISNSHVSGFALVNNSYLLNSVVSGGAIISGGQVFSSEVSDSAKILDKAHLWFCRMDKFAIVCGNARVKGREDNPVILTEHDYLDSGDWYRPPVTFAASSGFIVSEATGRDVVISCTKASVEKWLDRGAGRRYGKMVGMSPEEIDEVQYYTEVIRNLKNQKGYVAGR